MKLDPQPSHVVVFCDGCCEPRNPGGYACSAYVAFPGRDIDGSAGARRPDPIGRKWGLVARGEGATNNVAEYRAVLGGLRWALDRVPDAEVEVRTDSMLVVEQIQDRWKCNKDTLRLLRDEARELVERHGKIRLVWIPRDLNDVADVLTRRAYREARVAA